MIASEILTKGLEQGIITAEQAERLREVGDAPEPLESVASPDDEPLRFIGGFGGSFVVIGLAMFLGALGYFAFWAGGTLGMFIVVALAAWMLAEFFTRARRMASPSDALFIVFAGAVFLGASHLFGADNAPHAMLFGLDPQKPIALAGAAFLTALAAALHYWRFRVPMAVAVGCGALAGSVVGLVYGLVPGLSSAASNLLFLACGAALFAIAMRIDISDPKRLTRRADIAFWLHLLASPLIVRSLINGLLNVGLKLEPGSAVAILAVFLVISLVAILIDRRALLVSGLAYAGYSLWTLIRQAGFSNMTTPVTLLTLGSFVLLLSAGWRPLRARIMNAMPSTLARRLSPTSASA